MVMYHTPPPPHRTNSTWRLCLKYFDVTSHDQLFYVGYPCMVTWAYMDFHGYLENQDFQISGNIKDFLEIDKYSWISMDFRGFL